MDNKKQVRKVKKPSRALIRKIEKIEASKKGMVAAIEPKTGKYFLGKSVVEAAKKAKEEYPNSLFYFIRVGYPVVHQHKGGIRKL